MPLRAKLPIPEKATEGAGSLFRTVKTDAKVAFTSSGIFFSLIFHPLSGSETHHSVVSSVIHAGMTGAALTGQ